MSENKRSPWVLCPSKKIPGKFYYYNVLTGEAAWCYNEEKKFCKRDEKLESVDKTHSYPEPHSTPENQSLSNSLTFSKSCYGNHRPCQSTFGQAVFPKYILNQTPLTTNVIYTSTPRIVNKPAMVDSITQTTDTIILVPASNASLSVRFGSYKSDKDTACGKNPESEDVFGKINADLNKTKLLIKKPTLNLSALATSDNRKQAISNSSLLFGNRIESPKNRFKSSINTVNNFKNTVTTPKNREQNTKKMNLKISSSSRNLKLQSNDLRHSLEAKRRKMTETNTSTKKVELSDTSKKRVTFNLGNLEDTTSISCIENNNEDEGVKFNFETSKLCQKLRNMKNPLENTTWFISVDLNVLLDEYAFIEDLVLSDENCKLLISESCKRRIHSLCIGEQSSNTSKVVARHIYRSLTACKEHIYIQHDNEIMDATNKDALICCCLQIQKDGYHVVVITKDPDTYLKAKLCGLYVFMFDDIVIIKNSEIIFENKEITSEEKHENLFLQSARDFDPFALSGSRQNKTGLETVDCQFTVPVFKPFHTLLKNIEKSNRKEDYFDVNDISYEISSRFAKLQLEDDATDDFIEIQSRQNSVVDVNHKIENNKGIQIIVGDRRRAITRNKPFSSSKNEQSLVVWDSLKLDLNGNITNKLLRDKLRSLIKNESVKEKIQLRLDEYICWFTQVMENFICNVIQKKQELTMMTFYFGLSTLKDIYGEQQSVVEILDRIFEFGNFCYKYGTIKPSVKPSDLMMTIGFSFLLMESLKTLIDVDDIKEATDALELIIADAERTTEIDVEEVPYVTSLGNDFEDANTRRNFVKDQADIMQYLREHFTVWRNCGPEILEEMYNPRKYPHIIRTSAKNSIKITNRKNISLDNVEDITTQDNTFDVTKSKVKVIRNFNIVPRFEDRLKKPQNDDLPAKFNDSFEKLKNDCLLEDKKPQNVFVPLNKEDLDYNDIESTVILSTKDSGFNESEQMYQFIKCFLMKLGVVYKMIYAFVKEFAEQFKKVDDEKKKYFYDKTSITQKTIAANIEHFKSMIERESKEGSSLKTLFLQNGCNVSEDKRVIRYKQVITKCLEQAQILEHSLNVMMHLINENYSLPPTPDNLVTYFNIFE